MSTRVRLGGGPSRVPRVATTASTGSRSGRSGGSSRDRLRSVGQPRTSRQPLGASPIANQQRTRTTRTVPSAMRRSSSSASGTMGRSGRARTAEISDEYAAEYAAFNNFYVRVCRRRRRRRHALFALPTLCPLSFSLSAHTSPILSPSPNLPILPSLHTHRP